MSVSPSLRSRISKTTTFTNVTKFYVHVTCGSMHLSGIRLSVRPSMDHNSKRGCCGPGRQEISIDCCTAHSSAADECGQCHVVSVRRPLNTDLSSSCGRRELISKRSFSSTLVIAFCSEGTYDYVFCCCTVLHIDRDEKQHNTVDLTDLVACRKYVRFYVSAGHPMSRRVAGCIMFPTRPSVWACVSSELCG